MNLNNLINLVLNNLDDIKIEYSNVNGQESLKVNGEEICACGKKCECKKYDDSKLIEKIENHKNLLNELDDCLFMEVVDLLKEKNINLKALNEFMDKEHYSKEDEITANTYISIVSKAMYEVIRNKQKELAEIMQELEY